MVEIKGNKMTRNSWKWLGMQHSNIFIENINKEKSFNSNDLNINKKIENIFSNIDYGISKEYISLTKKNLNKYIYIDNECFYNNKDNDKDKEEDDVNNNDNDNILNLNLENKLNIKEDKHILVDICIEEAENVEEIDEKKKHTIYIDKSNIYNSIFRIYAKGNISLDIIIIDQTRDGAKESESTLESIVLKLEGRAKVNILKIDLSKKNRYFNYVSELKGNKCQGNIKYGYFLGDNLSLDMSFHQKYFGEESKGNLYLAGILNDNSKKIFKGTIDFKRRCKKAVGKEEETTMFLKDTAESISCPLLLSEENDIEGVHGTNDGKYDENILEYMMSRGIEEKEAKYIIAESKILPLVDTIKNKNLREELKEKIRKTINER